MSNAVLYLKPAFFALKIDVKSEKLELIPLLPLYVYFIFKGNCCN
jgi:hypothetical protein